MTEQNEVRLGMRVRDMNGRDLGTVVRKGENRFLVEHGRITKEALIIRDEYVAVVHEGEVVLNVTHRHLMDEMQHPHQKPAYVERYTYDEYGPTKVSPATPVDPARAMTEHPGKPRVVREEFQVASATAHEYEVKPDSSRVPTEEEKKPSDVIDDTDVHPLD